jgi:type VI secretion system protein ImpM
MSTAAGWFGKVSMLGDFASRRLEPAWVEACDRWLSGSMDTSRRLMGEAWMPAYLSAPLWRFAWAPGVVDHQWWFGVLMPSSDNVGRYFPLVVAQPRPAPPVDRFALDHLELWWQHVADAALRTLAEGAQVDGFEADLMQAPPWPMSPQAPPVRVVPAPGRERVSIDRVATLEGFMHGLAATSLLQRFEGCSLWSPYGGPQATLACTLLEGLPTPEAFGELLTGRW